ncbi:uncharacterized protein LOC136041960 [Artemia franciscana]|uniref:uncharacterized protein LOC136041960 n=1 Tax=Artemia franciscana TaxID=6661 RepID=UPI0032DB1945
MRRFLVVLFTGLALAQEGYDFSWSVNDGINNDIKSHQESSDGNTVRGEYSVVHPDGCTQLVRYEADENGYRPEITYKGNCDPTIYFPEQEQSLDPKGGEYMITFSDGCTQTVRYVADENGYKPDISYSGNCNPALYFPIVPLPPAPPMSEGQVSSSGTTAFAGSVTSTSSLSQGSFLPIGPSFNQQNLPVGPTFNPTLPIGPTFNPVLPIGPSFNPRLPVGPTFNPTLPVGPTFNPELPTGPTFNGVQANQATLSAISNVQSSGSVMSAGGMSSMGTVGSSGSANQLVGPTFNPEPLRGPVFNPVGQSGPTFNPELPNAPQSAGAIQRPIFNGGVKGPTFDGAIKGPNFDGALPTPANIGAGGVKGPNFNDALPTPTNFGNSSVQAPNFNPVLPLGPTFNPTLPGGPTFNPSLPVGPTFNPTLPVGPTFNPTLPVGPTFNPTLPVGPTFNPTLPIGPIFNPQPPNGPQSAGSVKGPDFSGGVKGPKFDGIVKGPKFEGTLPISSNIGAGGVKEPNFNGAVPKPANSGAGSVKTPTFNSIQQVGPTFNPTLPVEPTFNPTLPVGPTFNPKMPKGPQSSDNIQGPDFNGGVKVPMFDGSVKRPNSNEPIPIPNTFGTGFIKGPQFNNAFQTSGNFAAVALQGQSNNAPFNGQSFNQDSFSRPAFSQTLQQGQEFNEVNTGSKTPNSFKEPAFNGAMKGQAAYGAEALAPAESPFPSSFHPTKKTSSAMFPAAGVGSLPLEVQTGHVAMPQKHTQSAQKNQIMTELGTMASLENNNDQSYLSGSPVSNSENYFETPNHVQTNLKSPKDYVLSSKPENGYYNNPYAQGLEPNKPMMVNPENKPLKNGYIVPVIFKDIQPTTTMAPRPQYAEVTKAPSVPTMSHSEVSSNQDKEHDVSKNTVPMGVYETKPSQTNKPKYTEASREEPSIQDAPANDVMTKIQEAPKYAIPNALKPVEQYNIDYSYQQLSEPVIPAVKQQAQLDYVTPIVAKTGQSEQVPPKTEVRPMAPAKLMQQGNTGYSHHYSLEPVASVMKQPAQQGYAGPVEIKTSQAEQVPLKTEVRPIEPVKSMVEPRPYPLPYY